MKNNAAQQLFPGLQLLKPCDITTTDARTGYRLYPVQDIDSVLTNGGHGSSDVNVDDTFSLYCLVEFVSDS